MDRLEGLFHEIHLSLNHNRVLDTIVENKFMQKKEKNAQINPESLTTFHYLNYLSSI